MTIASPPSGTLELDRDVAAEARALAARWQDGDRANPAFRAEVSGALASLRNQWRLRPGGFDADAVALLRDVSRQVSAPVVAPGAAEAVLHDVFGYAAFRPGQKEIIDALLAGRDCVGVMPTGAGKSLTYQIPARMLGGTTLVVSPLIALMKDQVDALTEVGLRATYLNSTLDARRAASARARGLAAGEYELCYAAPEGIEASVGRAAAAAWTCASSPSTRPTASASGATTSGPPTATWPGSSAVASAAVSRPGADRHRHAAR